MDPYMVLGLCTSPPVEAGNSGKAMWSLVPSTVTGAPWHFRCGWPLDHAVLSP